MRNDGAKAALPRERIERAARFRDGNELVGASARHEVMAEGQRLNRVARLAREQEQRPRELIVGDGGAHRRGIRAVQHAQRARSEHAGEHVRDQTRSAHPTDERALETVGSGRRGQCGVRIPLRERLLRRAHPSEQIHWRRNIMKLG